MTAGLRNMNRIALVAGIFLLLGGLGACYFSMARDEKSLLPPESNDIFQALVRASSLSVPKQQLSCEVAGSRNGVEYRDTKVGDYIAAYLRWSQDRTRHSSSSLSCEGDADAVKKCTWVFGESKSNEGWNRFLRFDYNPTTKSVVPDSLECIDVP